MNTSELIKSSLEESKINYKYEDDLTVFTFKTRWSSNNELCGFSIKKCDDYLVHITAEYEMELPERKMADIVEYVARINYYDELTRLVVDFGENMIKNTMTDYWTRDFPFNGRQLRTMVVYLMKQLEKYIQGLVAVIYGEKTPEEAFLAIQ